MWNVVLDTQTILVGLNKLGRNKLVSERTRTLVSITYSFPCLVAVIVNFLNTSRTDIYLKFACKTSVSASQRTQSISISSSFGRGTWCTQTQRGKMQR